MPISGRFRITSIRLPIHMLVIMPQKSSGRSVITCGPGAMPWIIIAPIISAITGLDGMPKVSRGMKEVCAPALLADYGAGTVLEIFPGRHQARDLVDENLAALALLEVDNDLGEAEYPHGDDDEVDAVG